jgi:hypothetical protein
VSRARRRLASTATIALLAATAMLGGSGTALALGVGDASWTPVSTETTTEPSRFLKAGDSVTIWTAAEWDQDQVDGLAEYVGYGLRYTLEVNDGDGRLSSTGFWATNHPDPAFDRDDDDGDGRWEEAEVTAGSQLPEAGRSYTTAMQFSRWHAKRERGACLWAWDRRRGAVDTLSQMSRELLGEWQAERYTLAYARTDYPRVKARSSARDPAVRARCREIEPSPGQEGITVTFAEPLPWAEFLALPGAGEARWTAFEAIGSSERDDLPWTCGGPVSSSLALKPCRSMGVRPDGVVAAVGFVDGPTRDALASSALVARVADLRDPLTGLLAEVGGLGVEPPGLTVNDAYWEVATPSP